MSYDVSLVVPACGACGSPPRSVVDICLVAGGAMQGKRGNDGGSRSWSRLRGRKGGEAIPALSTALEAINDPARAAELRALEPANGWGDTAGVRWILGEFLEACRKHPRAEIEASG